MIFLAVASASTLSKGCLFLSAAGERNTVSDVIDFSVVAMTSCFIVVCAVSSDVTNSVRKKD